MCDPNVIGKDQRSVVIVIKMRQYNISLSSVPLQRWFGVHIAFNLSPPKNIMNLFGNWLAGVDKKERVQIRVGAYVFLWALWNVRNDYIFNRAKQNSFMQVILLVLPITNGQTT
jgi:hypothetical protein